jgi:hypothetical protein
VRVPDNPSPSQQAAANEHLGRPADITLTDGRRIDRSTARIVEFDGQGNLAWSSGGSGDTPTQPTQWEWSRLPVSSIREINTVNKGRGAGKGFIFGAFPGGLVGGALGGYRGDIGGAGVGVMIGLLLGGGMGAMLGANNGDGTVVTVQH